MTLARLVGAFDLQVDPQRCGVYDDPAYADTVRSLTDELHRLQAEVGDEPHPSDR